MIVTKQRHWSLGLLYVVWSIFASLPTPDYASSLAIVTAQSFSHSSVLEHFFEFHQNLFLTNGQAIFPVTRAAAGNQDKDGDEERSESKMDTISANENMTSVIKIVLGKAFRLPRVLAQFTAENLPVKFVFTANFARNSTDCNRLFVVGRQFEYRSWPIIAENISSDNGRDLFRFARYRTEKEEEEGEVESESESTFCRASILPPNGNLRQIAELEPLFENNRTVTSILSGKTHTELRFLSSDRYVTLDLRSKQTNESVRGQQWQSLGQTSLAFKIFPVEKNQTNDEDDEKRKQEDDRHSYPVVMYKDKFILRRAEAKFCVTINATNKCYQVCPIESESLLVQEDRCRPLTIERIRLGASFDDDVDDYGNPITAKNKKHSSLLMMISVVVVLVFSLIVIYILAAKYCCADSVGVIPISGLNSKYTRKLQSVSSIKTIEGDESLDTVISKPIKPPPPASKAIGGSGGGGGGGKKISRKFVKSKSIRRV